MDCGPIHYQPSPGRYHYDPADLDAFVASRTVRPSSPVAPTAAYPVRAKILSRERAESIMARQQARAAVDFPDDVLREVATLAAYQTRPRHIGVRRRLTPDVPGLWKRLRERGFTRPDGRSYTRAEIRLMLDTIARARADTESAR